MHSSGDGFLWSPIPQAVPVANVLELSGESGLQGEWIKKLGVCVCVCVGGEGSHSTRWFAGG